MSMNPWKLFDAQTTKLRVERFAADAMPGPEAAQVIAAMPAGFVPREIEWRRLNGASYAVAYDGNGRTRVVMAQTPGQAQPLLDDTLLRDAAGAMLPGSRVARISRLTAYDRYYYGRAPHTMLGFLDKRLPMQRVEYDDAPRTWLHLDPHTGAVVQRLDATQRARRWLFAFLHSWDAPPLLAARPLWDALLIAFSVGGALLSITGVVIGVRRLRG
jgi:hypothetical protein